MNLPSKQLDRRTFFEKTARLAAVAAAGLGTTPLLATQIARAERSTLHSGWRISYYRNGEIYVNVSGESEEKPITTGYMDFKPSWSKTDDMLVCFRRTNDDPVTANWKSAIFIIHVDGTGFHQLSDGTRTDFNPTWTRDGLNMPVWHRKNDKTGGYCVMQSRVGGKPGEEIPLIDERYHSWAHSCLMDGRILVNAAHPTMGWGVFLIRRGEDAKPRYERMHWELGAGPNAPGQYFSERDEDLLRIPPRQQIHGAGAHALRRGFQSADSHDFEPPSDRQQGRQADLVRVSVLDRWRIVRGVSLRRNGEEPALRLSFERRLNPARVDRFPCRLPIPARRGDAMLKP